MKHELHIEKDVHELPASDGWRQFVSAGTCTITCSCGYDSGTVPTTDATRLASHHVGYDITQTPTTPA